jgi:hypothetical protein
MEPAIDVLLDQVEYDIASIESRMRSGEEDRIGVSIANAREMCINVLPNIIRADRKLSVPHAMAYEERLKSLRGRLDAVCKDRS